MPEQGPYDDLVARLQALRADAGLPSFGDIATGVSRIRRERGATPERARVGRTTVYDAFRMGRHRIDAELVGDIARALGADAESAQGWVAVARHARTPDPVPDVPTSAPVETARAHEPFRGRLLVGVLLACLAANLLGRTLVGILDLRVYLDMIGTAFAAIALGPWWGALVGGLTNVAGVPLSGTDSLLFAPVNVVGALIWGYGAQRGLARTVPRFFALNLGVAVASSCIAVPTIVLLEHGFGGHSSDQITVTVLTFLSSIWVAVSISNLVTSLVDKLICGFVSLVVLESLPASRRPAGWLRGDPADARPVRECSGSSAPGPEGPAVVAG